MGEGQHDTTGSPNTPSGDFGYIPPLPQFGDGSPAVVLVHDKIRRELDDVDGFEEFCWFAREYPRCYRFHIDGAEFRLKSVHELMRNLRANLAARAAAPDGDTFEYGLEDIRTAQVYWNFESFLSEVSIALDLPPVDTTLIVVLRRYPDKWELRAKLPTNPNVRDILGFRYSRRVELLRYALRVYGELMALDRAVARTVWGLYRQKKYPVRKDRLFFVGRRERVP